MTGPRLRDVHDVLVDERAYAAVRHIAQVLERLGCRYVLAGGWPVFAYGSGVPSVDTDVFIGREDGVSLREALAAADPALLGQVDLLALNELNAILGPDIELGDEERGYRPATLLEGHTLRRALGLPREDVTVVVPDAAALAMTKLKAFHDRSLAWQATREADVMARIPPADRPGVHEKTEGYWYRKAGKDLYDVAFLAAHHTSLDEALTLAEPFDLRGPLEAAWRRPPRPLARLAIDFAAEDPETLALLPNQARRA